MFIQLANVLLSFWYTKAIFTDEKQTRDHQNAAANEEPLTERYEVADKDNDKPDRQQNKAYASFRP